jgi:hypothetical protein
MVKKVKVWGLILRVEDAGSAEGKLNNIFWISSIASAGKATLKREVVDGKLLIEQVIWLFVYTERKRERKEPRFAIRVITMDDTIKELMTGYRKISRLTFSSQTLLHRIIA